MKNPTCDTNVSKFAEIIPTVQVQNKNSELWRNFFLQNTIIRNLPN